MITRIWHGWTTHENADTYQGLLETEILPGIARKEISAIWVSTSYAGRSRTRSSSSP
jgi:hypothetical protein